MGTITAWRWLTDKAMITASLSPLMASRSPGDASSLTTSSLGKLTGGGVAIGVVVGELAIGSGSITGVAPLTAGAEDTFEATKSGVGSVPLRARISSHGLSWKKLGRPAFSLPLPVIPALFGLKKANLLFKDLRRSVMNHLQQTESPSEPIQLFIIEGEEFIYEQKTGR